MLFRSVPSVMKVTPSKYCSSLIFAHKFFDGVTFITEGTRDITERLIKRKFTDYRIYPSGFNKKIMKPMERDIKLCEELGIKKEESVIFYHGSISQNRGIKELVEAVELLKKKNKVKLLVIGSGDIEIIKLIKKQKENIFLDVVSYNEIPKYISIADVCVSPLPDILWWRIASSLKVIEYMACGKPIALTRMKAHTDVLPKESKGISYFERVTPEEIAEAIWKILNDKERFNFEAKNLHTHAINNFTYDSIAKKLLEYYKSLYNNY